MSFGRKWKDLHIFIYRIAGYFRGTNFSQISQTKHFLIFDDGSSNDHAPIVIPIFEALNVRVLGQSSKTSKITS